MKFFTFVRLYGNQILVRGYDDALGGSFMDKVPFKPTLFVPSKNKTKYKTLDGKHVSPIHPGTMRECRDFIEEYSGVSGTSVYGMERWLYQYIAEEYPDEDYPTVDEGRNAGIIGVGGLVLARIPVELADQRKEHYQNVTQNQMEAVDRDWMRENNAAMPKMAAQRKSSVSFGRNNLDGD